MRRPRRTADCGKKEVFDPVERKCVPYNEKNLVHRTILKNQKNVLDVVVKEFKQKNIELRKKKAEEKKKAAERRAKAKESFKKFLLGRRSKLAKQWTVFPGQTGFNLYVKKKMLEDGLPATLSVTCDGEFKAQAYQSTVTYLLRPETTVKRLLVIARTGSGKTFVMIKVLENFIEDPRKKFVVFPNDQVANNFYGEIKSLPSKFRDEIQNLASLEAVKSFLAKKYKLYALSYARAGGTTFKNVHKNHDNCIILMDEFHNLVSPTPDMKRFKTKLNELKTGLSRSKNSIVAGFTATPFQDTDQEGLEKGEELLNIIKQDKSLSDEGFICFWNHTPKELFPDIKKLTLDISFSDKGSKKDNQKAKYDDKNKELAKKGVHCDHEGDAQLPEKCLPLQNYANTNVYFNQSSRTKVSVGNFLKLQAIVEILKTENRKSLILVERQAGYKLAVDYLQREYQNDQGLGRLVTLYDKDEKSRKALDEFNSPENLRGDKIKCILADAKNFSEGVSFKGVRYLFLLNPPFSFGRYLQQIGRVLRSCAHNSLNEDERNVNIYMLQTKDSVDTRAARSLQKEQDIYENAMKRFGAVAVDKYVLERYL